MRGGDQGRQCEFVLPAGAPAVRPAGAAINPDYLAEETQCVQRLIERARAPPDPAARIAAMARELVARIRARTRAGGLDAFLQEYDLSSPEGVVLMCLAEALLRIPDDETADRLIAEKLAAGDWEAHLHEGSSLLVNASTWGLLLTGRVVEAADLYPQPPRNILQRLLRRIGEPVVRAALRQAMRIMAQQFVIGRNIGEAIARSQRGEARRYRYSFDMLGEAALTAADAGRYHAAYLEAIAAIGKSAGSASSAAELPSISVKLSALFPRYELAQRERVHVVLAPRLLALAHGAREAGIALTVDAEESERLELSLELIERVCREPALRGWDGMGLAVQAYQKRAPAVLRWCADLAQATRRRLNVRLVKGAYWDSEVKRAQERGLDGYPVFTRKANTDVSYLACARQLCEAGEWLYPQFATHNAQTAAAILEYTRASGRPFEFQRLHGMGEELYEELLSGAYGELACRVYAPVGSHEDLLPYLVRRLLENGANTSFVHRLVDARTPLERIVEDPVTRVESTPAKTHPRIPLPRDLYQPERPNARGLNLCDGEVLRALAAAMQAACTTAWEAGALLAGRSGEGEAIAVTSPAQRARVVGTVRMADWAAVDAAIGAALRAQPDWDATPAAQRAAILRRAAGLFEQRMPLLMAQCVHEAGKTILDSLAEVREAVDFLRYYAHRAEADFGDACVLPGPAGESNSLRLHGRGVFACISPWNFPLAIFTGQVSAALAAGNSVIAKPAEQTPLVAATAVALLHEAGVPPEALHLLPGEGPVVGARAVADPRVAGVAFTGSTETARIINRALAARDGAIPVLIAETGGVNAMIVDSSALPEQVVIDAVQSAFNSAGQRCSALRLLCLQEEIAPRVLRLLAGYMDELAIGDPALLSTDIGPVIDEPARALLAAHHAAVGAAGRWQHACRLAPQHEEGTFFAPVAIEIESAGDLRREVFGPILHVVRYAGDRIDELVDAINATGYGLTLGIHSRIEATVARIAGRARVGNLYVNRNMIGAVVGVQPFGGCGLSGTGPKAGGPHTLHRYA
ncbi:MAG: bifunctional proline dehydrogenase/L-glutamate gamma-semialdehyde dehydrogenase PutA, partial [Gammaproteobacteria bacterium]|nr:bifunctional proline dehydrogenase/L-glutamate gamma-semialdehyde dehydrogenase PutA [Gammaproteobacteria bacterium]